MNSISAKAQARLLHAAVRACCHRFVQIPAMHCLNLAGAVGVALYDRARKAGIVLEGPP